MSNDYPPDLQAALGREQPLRGKTTGALSGAFRGLFRLYWGSGTGAEFDLSDARECLLFILSFIPGSIALQRQIAVLEVRIAQAMHLADAPAASVHCAMRAVRRFNDLVRQQPAVTIHRIERAYALRCLANGWEALSKPTLARRLVHWRRAISPPQLTAPPRALLRAVPAPGRSSNRLMMETFTHC